MKKNINKLVLLALQIIGFSVFADPPGPYSPAAGQPGSDAVAKNDASLTDWATGVEVVRGWQDISNPQNGRAEFGLPQDALGPAQGGTNWGGCFVGRRGCCCSDLCIADCQWSRLGFCRL